MALFFVLHGWLWLWLVVSGVVVHGLVVDDNPVISLVLDPLDRIVMDGWFWEHTSASSARASTRTRTGGLVLEANGRAIRLQPAPDDWTSRLPSQSDAQRIFLVPEENDNHTHHPNDNSTVRNSNNNNSATQQPTTGQATTTTINNNNHRSLVRRRRLQQDSDTNNHHHQQQQNNAKRAWAGAFGWIQPQQPYSCHRADTLQFDMALDRHNHDNNNRTTTMPMHTTLQLVLYDDTACEAYNNNNAAAETSPKKDCSDPAHLDAHTVVHLPATTMSSHTVVVHRNETDRWDRIRGWKFVVEMLVVDDDDTDMDDNDDIYDVHLSLDHLACYGTSRNLLQAPFWTTPTYAQAVEEGVWTQDFFQSPVSEERSELYFVDHGDSNNTTTAEDDRTTRSLYVNYTAQVTEIWGGHVGLTHRPPGNAYYNLSAANHILLDVQTHQAATSEINFRFILEDSSDCPAHCNVITANEHWYSFHAGVLDQPNDNNDNDAHHHIVVPFVASDTAATPLWLTGWVGQRGNVHFDPQYIKGIKVELSLTDKLELGDLVQGVISLSNLRAVVAPLDTDTAAVDQDACVLEPTLWIDMNHNGGDYQDLYQGHEFLSRQCCQLCRDDPDCWYAIQDVDGDCKTAPYVAPESVWLLRVPSEYTRNRFGVAYMDDKRGSFCDRCTCRPEDATIDCRGRDLVLLPRTWDGDFRPRILDVRENPRMALLGSLDNHNNDNDNSDAASMMLLTSLEIVRLPLNLRYLPPEWVESLPNLQSLEFEQDSSLGITNLITSADEPFGDVCCVQSSPLVLPGKNEQLSFCQLQYNLPGADSLYLPFVEMEGPEGVTLFPSSDFLFEAAESVETCAAYCTIIGACQFFAYDGRVSNAEPSCSLIMSPDPQVDEVCCQPNSYGDANQTTPGWVSGVPPQTRHKLYQAKVQYQVTGALALDESNGYSTEYQISLGAMPMLGAVWVMPEIASSEGFEASIEPAKVVLYDNTTVVTVRVQLTGVGASGGTLVIQNEIESCDSAFTSFGSTTDNSIYLNVVPPATTGRSVVLGVVLGVILALGSMALLGVGLWYDRARKADDAVWKINSSDLEFADPPQIVGRGTFGLVLLANYRGTKVAVKRVIPPQQVRSGDKRTSNVPGSTAKANVPDVFCKTNMDPEISDSSLGDGGLLESEIGRKSTNIGTMSGVSVDLRGSTADLRSSIKRAVAAKEEAFTVGGGRNSTTNKNIKSILYKLAPTSRLGSFQHRLLKKEFVQEMKILARLRHPCITTVMGAVIEKKSEPMLVMEYMEHGSFYDILHNSTMPMGPDLVYPILADIIAGIQFLHLADPPVVHGDLKAANILVDDKFRAKVSDFGLSQKKNLGGTGTPYWMAPELLRKESTNTSMTDIYSFGMIIYEAFSRKEPYEGEDFQEVLAEVADPNISKRPPLPTLCPLQIESIMADCLEDEPSLRPTATELTTRLQRVKVEEDAAQKSASTVSLFDIFPHHVAEALRDGRPVEPEHRDCVTIFFSDIVGFTDISSTLEPRKIADMLDRLYNVFDELSHRYDIFKVETIGDAYMAVTNLVKDQPDSHAQRIAQFAISAIEAANQTLIDTDDPGRGCVNIRVGFHSGPVVADVVGNRNPRYCLFGDAVNTASRMESNSKENRIHCSEASAEILKVQCPEIHLRSRGEIPIKGKGIMHTYWVNDHGRSKLLNGVGGGKTQNERQQEMAKILEAEDEEDVVQPPSNQSAMSIAKEAALEESAPLREAHPANQGNEGAPKPLWFLPVARRDSMGENGDFGTVEERLNARLARNNKAAAALR